MSDQNRNLAWLLAVALSFLIASILLYPDFVEFILEETPIADGGIPPAFSGNRAAYGLALFSLFSMTSLSIRKLILLANQIASSTWRQDPDVGLYRIALALLLCVVIVGAGPDVVLLLIWGEASPRAITAAMTVDRLCDGLTIVPFLAAIACLVRAEQIERSPPGALEALHGLGIDEPRSRALFIVGPRLDAIAETVRIVLIVLIVAAGLALWK